MAPQASIHAPRHDAVAALPAIAEENNVLPTTVDKLKKAFDQYDKDGSGVIEYAEFYEMLATLLHSRNPEDLSRDRVTRFWTEIDQDQSGEVEFPEFCSWYLKYFRPDNDSTTTSIDAGGLMGKFYSSYDPRKQRASLVHVEKESYRAGTDKTNWGKVRAHVCTRDLRA